MENKSFIKQIEEDKIVIAQREAEIKRVNEEMDRKTESIWWLFPVQLVVTCEGATISDSATNIINNILQGKY